MKLKVGKDYTSATGTQWKWCRVRDCWQYSDYRYKIYPHNNGEEFTCASFGVWHDGIFKSFEEAEQELLEEST